MLQRRQDTVKTKHICIGCVCSPVSLKRYSNHPQFILNQLWYVNHNHIYNFWGTETWDFRILKGWSLISNASPAGRDMQKNFSPDFGPQSHATCFSPGKLIHHYRPGAATKPYRTIHRNVKLTWLVLGEDPAARSHRVEQFTALWGL